MKKFLLLTISLLLLWATQANALVINWEYDLDYYFSEYTIGATTTTPGDTSTTTLSWGTSVPGGGDPSSLSVVGYGTDSFDPKVYAYTDGGPVLASTLTHNNNPIWGDVLTSATISAQLTLTPHSPVPGSAIDPAFTTSFDFYFLETDNAPGHPENQDIFLLTDISATEESFLYDGDWYTYSFFPEDGKFDILPEWAKQNMIDEGYDPTVGTDGEYIGFVTLEPGSTSVNFGMMISSVPEPATMFLFGIGLMGIAGVSRRKNQK